MGKQNKMRGPIQSESEFWDTDNWLCKDFNPDDKLLKNLNSQIKYRTEIFTELQKNQILSLVTAAARINIDIQLEVEINVVQNVYILISFLESLPTSMKIKLTLKVQSISDSSSYEVTQTQFPQVISVDFGSLMKETELFCLVNIVQNSPNIKQLSLCSGDSTWRLCEHETRQITKFFQLVNLRNVDISCGDIRSLELGTDFFKSLQQQNVSFKKVNFKYDPRVKNKEFIDIFNQDLQEIYGLNFLLLTPPLKNVLPKLTLLDIQCSARQLVKVIDLCPNLQSLSWWESRWMEKEDWDELLPYNRISLLKLTRLVLGFRFDENPGVIERLVSRFSNVKTLKCQIKKLCYITWIYQYFPKLEEFEFFQEGGFKGLSLVSITGLPKSSLNYKLRDPIFRQKMWMPYIGEFKNLRVLNFGLQNYQRVAAGWHWEIQLAAFKYAICHLSDLNQITFPPMNWEAADKILYVLATKMQKQVKMVYFQIWSFKMTPCNDDDSLGLQVLRKPGYWAQDRTMKSSDIEKLKSAYMDTFEALAVEVKEKDDIHYSM